MDGLLSFLIFGGLFYVMMRYGCGAHMVHGHGHGAGHAGQRDEQVIQADPVCGRPVPMDQGYGMMHRGTLYRFCSRDCLDKFEADPERYAKPVEQDARRES